MDRDTIVDRLKQHAAERGDAPALFFLQQGRWVSLDWRGYAERCRLFAGALVGEGYAPGDAVAIMGNNSPEWVTADVGAMCARAVPAGIYQTNTGEQAAYVARHCDAKVLVLESKALYDKLAPHLASLPALRRVVLVRDAGLVADPRVVSFADFCAGGRAHVAAVDDRFRDIQDDDLATLIYTSGTTGPPKGAMLSHRNLTFTARVGAEMNRTTAADRVVSYLPLSHIAEQMFTIHIPTRVGMAVWFAEAMDKLKDALLVGRPTCFLAVPRVWEKFKTALEGRLREATGAKGAIVRWSRGVGLRVGTEVVARGRARGLDAARYAVARKLFFAKLAQGLGLDQLRVAVTGAAPIGKDVLEFFLSLGIVIHEVYGQTEGTGAATFNQIDPGGTRLGTVGTAFPGLELRLAADGEILVRGPNVFLGYFKDPEATAATVVEGWLQSGDIGVLDADGFLNITDRKKDLIITSGGKNVAPQNIEKLLRTVEGVGQAVVVGDRRKYLAALLTVDPEKGPALAGTRAWPVEPDALAQYGEFLTHLQRGVDAVNKQLAPYESIKRFVVLGRDFTQEAGELTPTQKLKRKVITERYAREIEGLYPAGDA